MQWEIQTFLEWTRWSSPIRSFCQEIKGFTNETERFKERLKIKFSEVFSGDSGQCNKMKANFELKENVDQVFKKKRDVPFGSLKQVKEKHDGLEKWVFYLKLIIAIGLQRYI